MIKIDKGRVPPEEGSGKMVACKRFVMIFLWLIPVFSACSYSVQPVSTRALNVYSAYENKVPGTFILIMDSSIRNVEREVTPASYVCRAHRYPINVGDSLAVSIKQTLESVFERVNEQGSAPSADQLNKLGYGGVILVKLDDFSPRILCTQGYFSGTCTSNTDISFGVTVRGPTGILVATAASGSKVADGEAGGACGGGATVISESITRATRDALERLAERLSNAPKLREAITSPVVTAPASTTPASVAPTTPPAPKSETIPSIEVGKKTSERTPEGVTNAPTATPTKIAKVTDENWNQCRTGGPLHGAGDTRSCLENNFGVHIAVEDWESCRNQNGAVQRTCIERKGY